LSQSRYQGADILINIYHSTSKRSPFLSSLPGTSPMFTNFQHLLNMNLRYDISRHINNLIQNFII